METCAEETDPALFHVGHFDPACPFAVISKKQEAYSSEFGLEFREIKDQVSLLSMHIPQQQEFYASKFLQLLQLGKCMQMGIQFEWK